MDLFNFSILPRSLKYSVVDWLHNKEVENLLKANQEGRGLILKRGYFPKYIEEITLWTPESHLNLSDDAPVLHLCILYHNFIPSEMENSLFRWSFTKDFNGKSFWNSIARIEFCKKLYLGLLSWPDHQYPNLIQQVKNARLFSKVHHFQLFQLESTIKIANIILEITRPFSIVELDVFINPTRLEVDELERIHSEILNASGFRDAKYIYFGCPPIDHWEIASKLKCSHVGLCIDEVDDLFKIFKDILRKGIPNQNSHDSVQLRSYLNFAQTSTEIYSDLVEAVTDVLGIKVIKPEHWDETESEAVKKLSYYTTRKYTYENLHSLQITHPQFKRIHRLATIDPSRSAEKFLSLKFNEKEYILMICVEDQREEIWPSVNVSCVFMPRMITEN